MQVCAPASSMPSMAARASGASSRARRVRAPSVSA
ncbi:Uncharacterised protein [Bordetella pertussis]|nr:Uncharacterised protein [Bordetella pertussis]